MNNGWKSDLKPLLARLSKIATGHGGFFVLAIGSRLALALPGDRWSARVAVDLYQPQRWKGRLFRILARTCIALGIPKLFATHRPKEAALPQVEWLREAAIHGCVGFLGCNPNHGPRCILAGIDPASGEPFIAKLGLDESAPSIRREAEVLEEIYGKYPGIIRPLGLISGDDWALLRLPHLGNTSPRSMEDPSVVALLEDWLGTENRPLHTFPYAAHLIDRVAVNAATAGWHDRMRSRPVRSALLHGDFAVWNLRCTTEGLVAIDWEWGRTDTPAGIDLAHGLRQECYMARGMGPQQSVGWILEQTTKPALSDYLAMCGWGDAHEDWLRFGLLHSHLHALNPSKELLAVLDIDLNS